MPVTARDQSGANHSGRHDLVIVGGGLVGASLAVAMAAQPLRIAVIERYPLHSRQQPSYDDRTVALSWGSRLILEGMGLWPLLAARVEPIRQIHISDRGHFGATRLHHDEESVDALGYVAENRVLGEVLYDAMNAAENIDVFCPASVRSLEQHDHGVEVDVVDEDGQRLPPLRAPLLVAADGRQSRIKRLLGTGDSEQAYRQSALIVNVTPGRHHRGVAYERFTASGPLAFLPMTENRCSVVWSQPEAACETMMQLDDAQFLGHLQQAFGYRLGVLQKPGRRSVYPLVLQQVSSEVHRRVAIIGNAAHTIHPVAGQGLNLSLRDVSLLAELLVDTWRAQGDLGDARLLARYQSMRQQDQQRVFRFTDGLVKLFSNALTPLAHARSLGLFAVDLLPGLKHRLARQSMGMSGRLSRLNRGGRL